ncbi:putative glutathionylspermidine synthase [Pseudomonas phage phiPMW]|uniref:Putative glutathionylspermidine synthase n=1 Tax=Pseudomonas phage phiPMW TaxID=1815582 RepID=A0A1S5R1G3_9CAUD|nr:glutathionylspermidine synthase [Pseudomonas phage phiPMW]ANA49227.1 putative glutathionylspermidine synthase [Pseudomonas phage phiPMW]
MHVVKESINFNINQVVREELPFLSTFYRDGEELNGDVHDLLSFPVANKDAMPFYTMRDETTYNLNQQFEDYYQMMEYALSYAFHDKERLMRFFDCEFMREHGRAFTRYAEATFHKKHPALYGRYDACFNPETEELEGVYEFNGDTPVMLFESVNIQNRLSQQLGTDQYNNWWSIFIEQIRKNNYQNVAVVCDTAYIEDMATCETLAQAFNEAFPLSRVQFLDIKELDFDDSEYGSPFFAKGDDNPLDAVYILSPWEEMVTNFPRILDKWTHWIDHVHVFEPAWRWFFANKGMQALCTHLMETSFSFKEKFGHVALIPTYLYDDVEDGSELGMSHLVEKPVVGRLSNNIKIWKDGEIISDTGGYYDEENSVLQEYRAPYKVQGRNNFILGCWMMGKYTASLCFREFDSEVLSIANERFIPHIII